MSHIENCGTLTVTDVVKKRKFRVISDTFQSDILHNENKTELNKHY